MNKEEIDLLENVFTLAIGECAYNDINKPLYDKIKTINNLCKKQKEVIDDYKEDISNLLDIINKNCNELKCTSDEWLVIQKYQDKEVSE